MRVLVTGGAGYIGSHTAKFLQRQGHIPVVLDDLSTGHREFVRFGPFELGDIRDEVLVFDILQRHAIDAVIHFAAKSLVAESLRIPEVYRAVNVGGMNSLLGAMQRAGVRRLVFSSSCAVYGPAQSDKMSESHALAPATPYGQTKLLAEQAIESVGPSFGLCWAVLRYFNVVGAHPDGELVEWHEPETHVLPSLLVATLANQEFKLFGDHYPTPDGTAIRDYVDVGDLARTHGEALAAVAREEKIVSNVGSGEGLSVRQLVAAVEQATGRSVRQRIEPPRPGDPPRLVADNRHLLTWSPSARQGFTPIGDSIRHVLHALSARPGSAAPASAERQAAAGGDKPG